MPIESMEDVGLPHRRRIKFGGAVCEVSSNSAALAQMLARGARAVAEDEPLAFRLNIRVDHDAAAPVGKPHFRGMRHVAFASFGSKNVFLFDLLRQQVSATVSATAARNEEFWSRQILYSWHHGGGGRSASRALCLSCGKRKRSAVGGRIWRGKINAFGSSCAVRLPLSLG
jgi:hypothetical protein